jgi:uncharacterized protein YndB with AHSA1/START domain
VEIAAPPERVFALFTRPDGLARWLGRPAGALDPAPGGRFALEVRGAPVRGRYLELDPPDRLVLSWGYEGSGRLPPGASIVEVRFLAIPGGTRVELEHRDLPRSERPGHVAGWTHYLARLTEPARAATPGRIPACRRPGTPPPDARFRRPA